MFEFLVFEHNIPTGLIITGLAVAVGSAVFSFLRFLPGDWRNLFLFVIRMLFLALLSWCLLLPQLRHSMTETIKPRFLVLVDTSSSMTVLPSKQLTTNRWAVAQEVLRQPWVKRLTAECTVDVFPFDRELGAPMTAGQAADLTPQGQASLLRDSLRKMLKRYRGQNIVGALLLSDGLDTREVHDDWARETWPCPIYTVRLEPRVEWEGEPDVHVDSVDTPRRVVVSWDTKLTAVISGQGVKGEAFNVQLQEEYAAVEAAEQDSESYRLEDADIALVAYGISARIAQGAVDAARAEGFKAGLFRPKTLYPFPKDALNAFVNRGGKQLISVEMSNGQMRDDVKLAIECRCPVHLVNRLGGNVVEQGQVLARLRETAKA